MHTQQLVGASHPHHDPSPQQHIAHHDLHHPHPLPSSHHLFHHLFHSNTRSSHHYPHTAHGTLLNTTHTFTRTYIAAANSKRKSMKLFAVAAAVLCATAAADEMVQQKGEVESVERRKNNGCRDRNISEIS